MKNSIHFNTDIALKILLLWGFAAFFLITIVTGSVNLYVHPRIIPYMIFASTTMLIISFLLLRDLLKPKGKMLNSWPLLFFVFPLIMAFSLPAGSFNSSTGTVGDVQLSSGGSLSNNTVEPAQEPEKTQNVAERAKSEQTNTAIPLQNGVLVMDTTNFYECLCDTYADMDKYRGASIEVVGFVFDSEEFSDHEFVPARLMMVCCAADMQPVGLLCRYDKASELEVDSWVKVSGTIEKTDFRGETIPCIVAHVVEKTKAPVDAYIYPY